MFVYLVILYSVAPDIYRDDISKMIFQLIKIFILQQHEKIDNIYVSTTGTILWLINIHQCRENIHHYMLAIPDYHNISIGNCTGE